MAIFDTTNLKKSQKRDVFRPVTQVSELLDVDGGERGRGFTPMRYFLRNSEPFKTFWRYIGILAYRYRKNSSLNVLNATQNGSL